ncbi:hypothetical protein [Cognatiluteimonas weifangensis]|uniref:hypothetical protein n=1 Tax=Cognatiluteimonas weifangensis TaxID=2303539 RepID=UPI0011C1C3F6|nr:hypothetical protein [Luteimonas weifangensis]
MSLFLSSAPLVRLGEDSLPNGIASACLVDYRDKRILLTVSHATGDQGNWALQLRYVPQKGTQLRQLGAMNFLAKATLSSPKLKDVDFSYVELPQGTVAYRQEIEAPTKVRAEAPITVHAVSLTEMPDPKDRFGFCGMVLPAQEEHFGQTYLSGEIRIYEGLSFLRFSGDYIVFKLPFKHPGHKYFKGCSGAPIINSDGVPVALVCEGSEEEDEILGISLAAYKVAIDIMIDFG